MKEFKALQILLIILFLITDVRGMNQQEASEEEHQSQLSSQIQTEEIHPENRNAIQTQLVRASIMNTNDDNVAPNRGRNYEAFLHSIGMSENIEKMVESCKYLESLLSEDQIAQADMEILSPNSKQKESLFDWVTRGWGFATWFVGSSQNIATIAIVGCAIITNIFPDQAQIIAIASGSIAAVGSLLSNMYSYCKGKKLKRIAYNLIVLCGQLEVQQSRERIRAATDGEA